MLNSECRPIVHFHCNVNVNVRGGGDTGYSLCIGDVLPPRVCFSQSLPGKGVVSSPNSLARDIF